MQLLNSITLTVSKKSLEVALKSDRKNQVNASVHFAVHITAL